MASAPAAVAPPAATSNGAGTAAREPFANGQTSTSASSKPKTRMGGGTMHGSNSQYPLSSMKSDALDLASVERRGQPLAMREPSKPRVRPHNITEAPTYYPTEAEWRDPLAYMRKIEPEASQYGICKVIPPETWNPDFAIDTEKFHFRTRKQELNSVEGSTRANLTYLDGLTKFHKQHGNQLHRLPYVDKKPLDLYRLKKAVEARGSFDQVCKLKKWAEIGRDLGYSGKIMSSLSTSLKNSYQKWLCPYEDYLRIAKPGVHQQLEQEYGGPLTPDPALTPSKRSNGNTPLSTRALSPTRHASDNLQATLGEVTKREDADVAMEDAPLGPPKLVSSSSAFTAVNKSAFTAVNSTTNGVRKSTDDSRTSTPNKRIESPSRSTKPTPEDGHGVTSTIKRHLSMEESGDNVSRPSLAEKQDSGDNSGRRSKRLRKDNIPTVAGSHMTTLRQAAPRVPRDDSSPTGGKCEACGHAEDSGALFICESCDHAYHGLCLDPPIKKKSEGEWNCPRCLVGDGQFGFEEGGLYSLKQFQQKANDFKQGYFENKMPFDPALRCHRPVTEEDVETEFWRLVADIEETVEVEYGADIHCTTHGSGFPTPERHPNNVYASDQWNLNNLPFHQDSLFRHIKSDISGMTVPWVYVGMIFSTFCWHNEDHYAYSANYQHFGATKTWYGIPGDDAEKFEAAMRDAVPELFETQPDLLFQLVTLLTPEQLRKAGVRVYAADQRAGQFVITFPQAYHAGFNHGFNFNEAVNFAPSDWEPYGLSSVERLQSFRRPPCFSHEELLYTAAQPEPKSGLSIETAVWLAPALVEVNRREWERREVFLKAHKDAKPHECPIESEGDGTCDLTFAIDDRDVQDEEEQCCTYCKAFAYLSRFKCHASGKTLCLYHAGTHACCDVPENQRLTGEGHSLIYRKSRAEMSEIHEMVLGRANEPDLWVQKYEKVLDEDPTPPLKSLISLLREGERIDYDIPTVSILKHFVDRCNEWVSEARPYLVRNRVYNRKSDRNAGSRKSVGGSDEKDQESRSVDDIQRLLKAAEQLGVNCPEVTSLTERSDLIKEFRDQAAKVLQNSRSLTSQDVEDLLDEGRSFNVDMPELDSLAEVQAQMQWNEDAREYRNTSMALADCKALVEHGKKIGIPPYNDHLTYFTDQMLAGEAWERKAKELIETDTVHYPQLEALSTQAKNNNVPVSQDLLNAVEGILHKQREAHRQILDTMERCQDPDYRKRPKYSEVVEITKRLEDLNSKPNGAIDLDTEKKRHEDWMRKGKRLFGKSNAPLHILKSHLEYVLERNIDCFDTVHDTPRLPGEPTSREASPEHGEGRWEDPRSRAVFCICRKVEAGMMIECELCHEWYHYKCLKLARGRVKEDDKYTCPICDWRMKIPRDASRPKLTELIALAEEMETLPFQPDEEEVIRKIIDNASMFQDHIARYCQPLLSTGAEAETQRFYLRKLEGGEVLLAHETNFLRQELHKWCPVAPEPPPHLEVSLSTRKPRPTKLQKMLLEYGVDNPDDLPEHAKGKANSLRRKAANAEAVRNSASGFMPPNGSMAYGNQYLTRPSASHGSEGSSHLHGGSEPSGTPVKADGPHSDPMDIDSAIHPQLLGGGSNAPHLFGDEGKNLSLEDLLLSGHDERINLHSEGVKSKALDFLRRTENGRKQAERIWGPDVWGPSRRSLSGREGSMTPVEMDPMLEQDSSHVDQMFKEMTNQDEDEETKKKETGGLVSAELLESEKNGIDAVINEE